MKMIKPPFNMNVITYDSFTLLGPRIQKRWQMLYVYEGCIELWLDNKRMQDINAGEIFLLKPGREEKCYFAREGITRHGWCDIEPIEMIKELGGGLYGDMRVIPLNNRMRHLIDHAESLRKDSFARSTDLFSSLCLAIFLEYFRASGIQLNHENGAVDHPAVIKAIEFMQGNLGRSLELATIADAAGIAESHLIHLFRKHKRETPMKFWMNLRISEAARLLRESGLTASEISEKCGFSNPQHFSKTFKKMRGQGPRRYRKNAWEGL